MEHTHAADHTTPEPHWSQPEGTNIQIASAQQPSEEALADFVGAMLAQPALARQLDNVRYRILSARVVEPAAKHEPDERLRAALRVSAMIYDYTNNAVIEASAMLSDASDLRLTRSTRQPPPSAAEFEEAVEILHRDEVFGHFLLCHRLVAYRPMPALILTEDPTGRADRTLGVGLMPAEGSELQNQIVAVNMVTQRVHTFRTGHPDTALASHIVCGIPPVYCASPQRGTPGQLWISWPADNPVWRFLAVRPSASSGMDGSGLEIRYANYRGKRVLYHGHVPVLNVKYDGNACGPYRDWQHEEHCFEVHGSNLAPGFRWGNSAPKTACNGSDAGNFTGVSLHETDCELILTTEMEAGWYRYIQEWRFHKDGTIRPRFKFTAVRNSCVCKTHIHHVYWRLDFDLRTPGNNLVEEFNNPPLVPGSHWHKKTYEIKRYRDYGRQRKWRVRNTATGEAYEIIPGPTDGIADTYGRGDFWIVRYHGNEIDDGGAVGGTEAHIDKLVTGELVENQDVVVWYGAHFKHSPQEQGTAECHSVGPTLRLTNW